MKAKDVAVNLEELKKFKRQNFEDRLKFIDFWVEYMKKHSDHEWSKQQAQFIDAQYETARAFWKRSKDMQAREKDVNA